MLASVSRTAICWAVRPGGRASPPRCRSRPQAETSSTVVPTPEPAWTMSAHPPRQDTAAVEANYDHMPPRPEAAVGRPCRARRPMPWLLMPARLAVSRRRPGRCLRPWRTGRRRLVRMVRGVSGRGTVPRRGGLRARRTTHHPADEEDGPVGVLSELRGELQASGPVRGSADPLVDSSMTGSQMHASSTSNTGSRRTVIPATARLRVRLRGASARPSRQWNDGPDQPGRTEQRSGIARVPRSSLFPRRFVPTATHRFTHRIE
jgi:hypothetical protein